MARAVIQHAQEPLFLRADRSWTKCIEEAEAFANVKDAAEACMARKLEDVRIAVHMFGQTISCTLADASVGCSCQVPWITAQRSPPRPRPEDR